MPTSRVTDKVVHRSLHSLDGFLSFEVCIYSFLSARLLFPVPWCLPCVCRACAGARACRCVHACVCACVRGCVRLCARVHAERPLCCPLLAVLLSPCCWHHHQDMSTVSPALQRDAARHPACSEAAPRGVLLRATQLLVCPPDNRSVLSWSTHRYLCMFITKSCISGISPTLPFQDLHVPSRTDGKTDRRASLYRIIFPISHQYFK